MGGMPAARPRTPLPYSTEAPTARPARTSQPPTGGGGGGASNLGSNGFPTQGGVEVGQSMWSGTSGNFWADEQLEAYNARQGGGGPGMTRPNPRAVALQDMLQQYRMTQQQF